jgi:hypothetical protein
VETRATESIVVIGNEDVSSLSHKAAGSITWPDGAGSITFGANVKLIDIVFAATLATTPTLTVNVGGQPVHIMDTATMVIANDNRPLLLAPIRIPQGSSLNIVQS